MFNLYAAKSYSSEDHGDMCVLVTLAIVLFCIIINHVMDDDLDYIKELGLHETMYCPLHSVVISSKYNISLNDVVND